MSALSGNGWPAYNTTDNFVRGSAAGFSFWCANEDVRTIFEDLVTRFDEEVESVSGGTLDDWSWADRNVRGSDTAVSNHASATALDLNALKHPRGVKSTFTIAQEAAVRKILASYNNTVRWGEDYENSPTDGMHFEINASKARVRAVAEEIRSNELANLTEKNLQDIAYAVLVTPLIPNKNAPKGSKKPVWTLRTMISDIEDTQDSHTKLMNAQSEAMNAIIRTQDKILSLLENLQDQGE